MAIFPSTEKIAQLMTHPNKINSPYPNFLLKDSSKLPLEMTIIAPTKDSIMPVNIYLVNFSLKINIESIVISKGFKEIMIDARLAEIYFNPRKKKTLKPTMPVNPREMINKNCKKLIRGSLSY